MGSPSTQSIGCTQATLLSFRRVNSQSETDQIFYIFDRFIQLVSLKIIYAAPYNTSLGILPAREKWGHKHIDEVIGRRQNTLLMAKISNPYCRSERIWSLKPCVKDEESGWSPHRHKVILFSYQSVKCCMLLHSARKI